MVSNSLKAFSIFPLRNILFLTYRPTIKFVYKVQPRFDTKLIGNYFA